ncbi:MAG: hypothetical protein PHQ40_00505 [Anaerolineaceae bacterium]|nr:hypothetical protein [Anaerolineaceae bacterium]MDD5367537.1 hypothetical protein [Anaerolineaceae bacterium]
MQENIFTVLKQLWDIYPNHRMDADMSTRRLKSYAGLLADIPLETLKQAVVQVAANMEFFPSVYELRRAAVECQQHGKAYQVGDFTQPNPMKVQAYLVERRLNLMDRFYREAVLDQADWELLAREYLIADMPYGADYVTKLYRDRSGSDLHPALLASIQSKLTMEVAV